MKDLLHAAVAPAVYLPPAPAAISFSATFIAASSLGFQRTSPPILYGLHSAQDRRLRFRCFLIVPVRMPADSENEV